MLYFDLIFHFEGIKILFFNYILSVSDVYTHTMSIVFLQALHPDLSNILKDQKLLYAFMQFLKGEGVVNMLQFCLDVGE